MWLIGNQIGSFDNMGENVVAVTFCPVNLMDFHDLLNWPCINDRSLGNL